MTVQIYSLFFLVANFWLALSKKSSHFCAFVLVDYKKVF
ncbi:uncharacterized protein MP3633_2331 [Marinomonas primoryensis]|uniref:Uncharacterized protein n=1 Tax=Marinomonas primoryensis TaxID=178399 RepID=A0A859CWU7_9GAMM|nr:uncharacterized protein MP3633_2331 [Marinomonas primoryensis]